VHSVLRVPDLSIRGHCKCRNIDVHWHSRDYTVVPRRCQCRYCLSKNAAYVSKSGTRVDILIRKSGLHIIHQQGSRSAEFHECGNCQDLVFVTAWIDGELFCALNANCLANPQGFSPGSEMTLFDQTATEKKNRWRQNWCHPVFIARQEGK